MAAASTPRPCVFCAIVSGDVVAPVVTETEHTVAFLDHSPLFRGHTLVVTRMHVETLRDLPDDLLTPFFTEVRRL
ncbi:MAG: HIT family protein, partial [Acidimicrobiia bacterium]